MASAIRKRWRRRQPRTQARATALSYLADDPAEGALHALRINGLDTPAGISDLDALLGSGAAPDFLVLPKTETAGHLQILDRLLTATKKISHANKDRLKLIASR